MTLANDIVLFSRVPLFEGFSHEQLRLIAFGSKRRFYRAGETLFQIGDFSDGGYVVVNGQIDLVVMKGNRQFILSSHRANGLIGELSLITENQRSATAIASVNSELLFVSREAFRRMLSEYPQLVTSLYRRISASMNYMLDGVSEVQDQLEENPGFEGLDIGFGDGDHRN